MVDPFIAGDKRFSQNSNENQTDSNQTNSKQNGEKIISTGHIQDKKTSKRQVKKGRKLSFKVFIIGCFLFGLFLLLAGGFIIFSIIKSPETLKSLGIELETMKQLLLFFSIVFFGILFFVAFIMLLVNLYRLSTVKSSKGKYLIGGGIGFFLLIISLGLGAYVLMMINKIQTATDFKTNNLVDAFIRAGDGNTYLMQRFGPLIAPVEIEYKLNGDVFFKRMAELIGTLGAIRSMELDCGNGQILNMQSNGRMGDGKFIGHCLYLEKKQYDIGLKFSYFDRKGQLLDHSGLVSALDVKALIKIEVDSFDWVLNDNKNEIKVGTLPSKVNFNANQVFSDLNISGKPEMSWDLDGDGNQDSDSVLAAIEYSQVKLYEVKYKIPTISNIPYQFKLRVDESDIPQCGLIVTSTKIGQHKFSASMDLLHNYKDYKYKIIDNESGKVLEELTRATNVVFYNFKKPGKYLVQLTALTSDGKKSFCESDIVDTTTGKYIAEYEVFLKNRDIGDFQQFLVQDNIVKIDVVPMDVRIDIKKIIGGEGTEKVTLFVDDEEINQFKNNVFLFSIQEDRNYTANLIITDSLKRESKQQIEFEVKEKPLIGILQVSPETGTDPLEVRLDASLSKMNDPNDEIIYFTWDFGDGEIKKNVSTGKVSHIYKFNDKVQEGRYTPKVTITTKNGYSQEVVSPKSISVKRKEKDLKISFDSHPSQNALQGDIVRFSVITDGKIKRVSWSFGNEKTLNCDGRECMSASTSYDKLGFFDIIVSVEFEDYPTITKRDKIRITK